MFIIYSDNIVILCVLETGEFIDVEHEDVLKLVTVIYKQGMLDYSY